MNASQLLPIGSVVLVKEAEKKLMIIGILQKAGEKQYDYMGVLYPEGFLDEKHLFMFNHADIQEISYIGFIDAEYQYFRNELNAVLSKEEA